MPWAAGGGLNPEKLSRRSTFFRIKRGRDITAPFSIPMIPNKFSDLPFNLDGRFRWVLLERSQLVVAAQASTWRCCDYSAAGHN
jgi:hypothetical protein